MDLNCRDMIRTLARAGCLLVAAAASTLWGQGGPPGASVSKILSFPSEPGLLFAATNFSGIYGSSDAGQNWAPRSSGLTIANVLALAGTPEQLYAGTSGDGVFRSRDAGLSWEAVNQGLTAMTVASLVSDPADPDTVYAGTSNGGIFKTTNAGDAWVAISDGLARIDGSLDGAYLDLTMDPNDPQIVYAAHASLAQPGAGFLFKTIDGGQQWVGSQGTIVFSVTLSPTDPQIIYLGTDVGVLTSPDGGANFEGPMLLSIRVIDVAVDPRDADTIYAATQLFGIVKTTDGGEIWTLASGGLPPTATLALELDAINPALLYFGASGPGVFRTNDGAASWQLSSNGMNAASVEAMAVNPTDSSNLLAAVSGGELFQSANGGSTWVESRSGLTTAGVSELAFDPANPKVAYASSRNPFDPNAGNRFVPPDGAFYRSADGGHTWEELIRPLVVTALVVHPSDGRTVYLAGDFGVIRSQDSGQNFETRGSNDIRGLTIIDLAIDPQRPDNLHLLASDPFAFFPSFFIFRSDDGGDDWEASRGTSTFPLNVIAVDPTDSERIYVGATGGMLRSTNRGRDFDDKSNGLPNDGAVIVTSIVIDANDRGTVYIAASGAVFKSTNRADSWAFARSGLEGFFVQELAIDPTQPGVLYAASVNGGVFKTTNGGANWEGTGQRFEPLPRISAAGIVGAADFMGGGVAPGEIVSIFGQDMGPIEGVITGFDPDTGRLPGTVEGVGVFFGGTPAPLFFVRGDQINVQVPYEVAGFDRIDVRVIAPNRVGNTVSIPVLESHPGVFSAVLNQDFTVNSSQNPAAPRGFISLFVTGQGLVDPALATGAPSAAPFPVPKLPIKVTVGGRDASNIAAVLAPAFVGLLQVNARLSAETASGANDVIVSIGEQSSRKPVSVFVQ